jgi:hypothetical protein
LNLGDGADQGSVAFLDRDDLDVVGKFDTVDDLGQLNFPFRGLLSSAPTVSLNPSSTVQLPSHWVYHHRDVVNPLIRLLIIVRAG